ncbi:transposase, IS4 family [Jeotgalibacillus soli]|uniref:Transposase, IS4 family n=1 Tax=Jeotgalibacillus soli TaxID=889306 RepID=A0A0C2VMM3_9BACL|nr:transposase, IS4 family [Jeotgalibacillus soli]
MFVEKGVSYPEKAVMNTAKEHLCGQLEIMVDDKACIYVFDRMTDDGYFFLSRLRKMSSSFRSNYKYNPNG